MPSAPSPAELRAYRDRTGCTAPQAADHFYAGVDEVERERAIDRIKKVFKRGPAPIRQFDVNRPTGDVPDGPPRPDADYDTARLEKIAFLEWHLAELLADLQWVRDSKLHGRIGPLATLVLEARQQLDAARGEGERIKLDRNAGAVAEEVERRSKRIRQLAAAANQAKERDL